MISVLIADDQAMVRAGLRLILEAEDDIVVVAEAENGKEGVSLARREKPDVVLMDVRMPVMDGLEATRQITEQVEGTRVIVLTTFDLDDYVYGKLRASYVVPLQRPIVLSAFAQGDRGKNRDFSMVDGGPGPTPPVRRRSGPHRPP